MKSFINKTIILFILVCLPMTFCGCWDYTEMHDITFAAGICIDKDNFTNEYILTIETLKTSTNGEKINSDIIQSRGKTLHTALRDAIKETGKQIQVSHMKVVVVSQDIANDGIGSVIDLMNRDMEVRNDMWILISQMNTASEIFIKGKENDEILSYRLSDTVSNHTKIGKYTSTEAFKLLDNITTKGISATVPMVKLSNAKNKSDIEVSNVAVFRGDHMVGKLTENESMMLQLLKEENAKFLLPISLSNNINISLELIDVHRKTNIKTSDGKISIDIYLNIDTSLSELSETEINFVSKPQRNQLKKQSEKYIKNQADELIQSLQNKYKTDAIGTGQILSKKKPDEWKKVSDNWNNTFQSISINVFPNINIKYSGAINKNVKVAD
ncbi:Ger(x)C family spore germination protein [Clostridium botulinum]|nr:Ger(x)C family spore germination protein [Clostridium botulinum]